jgi:hypothetical protein
VKRYRNQDLEDDMKYVAGKLNATDSCSINTWSLSFPAQRLSAPRHSTAPNPLSGLPPGRRKEETRFIRNEHAEIAFFL